MFKTATSYLSGVSVFYGDDITRRDVSGEVVVFIGPAAKGPNTPLSLKNIDNAIPVYGTNNPLVKAAYEFWDGYQDSPQASQLQIVMQRIGGIGASLTTSYGLTITTTDAYDGIENDFYAFIDTTTAVGTPAIVKVWDSNKFVVYDNLLGIDAGYVTVTGIPNGAALSGKKYGKDLDNDPLAIPVSLAALANWDLVALPAGALHPATKPDATATTLTVASATDVPESGTLALTATAGAVSLLAYANFTFDVDTKTFTLSEALGLDFTICTAASDITLSVVGTTVVKGDSQLNLSKRELYELFRNGLLEVEQYTPDYIVPGGACFDDKATYTKTTTETSTLITALTVASTYAKVDAAATWPKTGSISVDTGTGEPTVYTYTDIVEDGEDFRVVFADGQTIGDASAFTTLVTNTWTSADKFELGLGYVKETDEGDHYSFTWSDVKLAGYGLAHFGYLFANFCNNAAVGYNAPLCGMNTSVPAGTNRSDIVTWIGTAPEERVVAGMSQAVQAVTKTGTGLLGDPIMAGSVSFNRCYMNDINNNVFVDPGYGLLLTDSGFVDGHEIKDTFYKVVDLGKYMTVGASLLTFNNAASGYTYLDTCGIYALGQLSGKPKGHGTSFSQIGTNSNVTVGVVVHRKLCNDLAGAKYVVVTREKGAGWVLNNDPSVARTDSAYHLISTTRTVKTVMENRRAELVGFIGKPSNKYYYEAARTKLSAGFKADSAAGLLNGYQFDLQVSQTSLAIGKLYLRAVLNPPLELVAVDVDAVIDRNVTTE